MIQLSEYSTEPDKDLSKEKAEELRLTELARIEELQIRLFASKKKSLLIILQGMDASGKDGTVKKLFSVLNPLGCTCKAWKAPTPEELSRDFLWRIHKELPQKGWIQIFNRSHYEDILVPFVSESLSKDKLKERLEFIDSFEEFVSKENQTHILKFFLHISREEQIKRIEERLSNPEKNWKFDPSDLEAHKNFKKYLGAYEWIFSHSKDRFPWVVVPSDKKWYRDYLIAKYVRKELENMDLKYPKLEVQPGGT
ncbi:PPK2 family polyphosphate kinase [Leptospira licerasiae]|uniref:Polyphosphate:nucleotide phosphotransferase, PPK2 family n=1 Tax=Leptospira licerasiae str. MMD4847 TaxID=1049971 RepID=A0ABP2R8Z5_9LEPT|nr:PPK2 family polyphosphate kinase [Leptospira licerasiae]EIE02528.1 polyphosphate:nucleotide phosphotransferase, PPK2 family [Leptospira licerasiae serovar Varillal str. VAR 010]EJZ40804.1 polyphosphate:nucleotide phosphotransferase, PPK2 family [Leptospira licerasiae str. MMD4847]